MVRIYSGEHHYHQIYPMKLRRKLRFESLMKLEGIMILCGIFPQRGQEEITLDNRSTHAQETYQIKVEGGKWKEELCKKVAVEYKNAVIVLTVT